MSTRAMAGTASVASHDQASAVTESSAGSPDLLLARAQSGDPASFEALLLPHEPALRRLALAMLLDRSEAEDVLQDVAERAWKSLRQIRQADAVGAWLRRIVVNECRRRLGGPWRRLVSRVGLELPGSAAAATHGEEASAVRAALAKLPADHRTVLVLRYYHDLSVDDIAALIDVPPGTVKSRLNRASGRLRSVLASMEGN